MESLYNEGFSKFCDSSMDSNYESSLYERRRFEKRVANKTSEEMKGKAVAIHENRRPNISFKKMRKVRAFL